MSLATELHALASKVEPIGDDALEMMKVIFTNPEAPAVVSAIARTCGFNLPAGTITKFGASFEGFISAVSPVPGPQPAS